MLEMEHFQIDSYYGAEEDKKSMKQENIVFRAGNFFVKRLKLILDRGDELEDWHKWGLLDYMVVGIRLFLCTTYWSLVIPLVKRKGGIGRWKLSGLIAGDFLQNVA